MHRAGWDLYCRVVDNHGDAGVCWRLAADLAARGEQVRLWIDDASALGWMAPDGAAGVAVHRWPDAAADVEPADIVIEAFGCALPPQVVARMAARARPPVWIDLEYLSAESYVERSHGLASPQPNGLVKWFFYPGCTPRTGGLIREPGLLAQRAAFDADRWLAGRGLARRRGERVVSLFCYAQPALPALLHVLADEPTLLLLTPGPATRQTLDILGGAATRGRLRTAALPALTQTDFDRLLWSCDLNLVRGEDSFVRAQWAGAPFVWQAYTQADGAHHAKVDAFLARHLERVDPSLRAQVAGLWQAWNGATPPAPVAVPALGAWRHATAGWRATLLAQADLTAQLIGFVRRKG